MPLQSSAGKAKEKGGPVRPALVNPPVAEQPWGLQWTRRVGGALQGAEFYLCLRDLFGSATAEFCPIQIGNSRRGGDFKISHPSRFGP